MHIASGSETQMPTRIHHWTVIFKPENNKLHIDRYLFEHYPLRHNNEDKKFATGLER
jgi:hypothetical protein